MYECMLPAVSLLNIIIYGFILQAMARDRRNYYQDTPKQIKRKIETFKKIPDLYDAYRLMQDLGNEGSSQALVKFDIV